MNKIKCLFLAIILCLAIAGDALADETANLVQWSGACISSDPPGTLDYIDPGNPNGAADIGNMQCWLNKDNNLECKITNGYPGYQASVHTEIINITREPVRISDVNVTGNPDCILVKLTDVNGNSLINQIIDKNSSIEVRVVNRIKQNAAQAGQHRFQISLSFNQGETASTTSSCTYYSKSPSINFKKILMPISEFIINTIQQSFSVIAPELKYVANQPPARIDLYGLSVLPPNVLTDNQEVTVDILPITDEKNGRLILFMGAGLSMGSIGYMLKRKG